jgi:beta-N-acetylhexosaminidase
VFLAVALALSTGAGAAPAGTPSLEQLVGARLVVALRGAEPSADLLARIERGELAGVILFAGNLVSAPRARALTASLQAAARAGGQPPVLVCVDQEGGRVRRVAWAPPVRPARELGRLEAGAVRRAGAATGRALRAVGVNCDLAPVADVSAPGSFLGERAFSGEPERVATHAAAFAAGLADAGIVAAAKHFPGVGRARVSTDRAAVRIGAARTELERDLAPFRRLVAEAVPLVMLSNASYPALDGKPATWSPAIANGLLRRDLGFSGVTITDSLDAAAAARGWTAARTAVLAAQAGVDLLLVTGSEETSRGVFTRLVQAASVGRLPSPGLVRSHERVARMRGRIAARG